MKIKGKETEFIYLDIEKKKAEYISEDDARRYLDAYHGPFQSDVISILRAKGEMRASFGMIIMTKTYKEHYYGKQD